MESNLHQMPHGPVGDVGPPFSESRTISGSLADDYLRGSLRGLNIDGYVIFDMQPDGGVDGIGFLFSRN
jgi:hypothetical protein